MPDGDAVTLSVMRSLELARISPTLFQPEELIVRLSGTVMSNEACDSAYANDTQNDNTVTIIRYRRFLKFISLHPLSKNFCCIY